ncbi:MgtC/SapB family protein [Terriglobus saanensis]|uniref:MgtC/SapB transporter n=1 Tax=Terriglobus saanensis (strain ATCC BAA-1853 / DSM 23119 / SP1PR4) TaxID=401053 RepID=E8V6F8_TERSS|nr:MgtC/SapB family protein [Terriglobus saanensis]ADV81623.1 MgtC/SapB transporter [Terriglobus saanensis SP1PR4]
MPLDLHWQQIALRLALACVASLAIGYNRDEHGRPAGMRTIMLVTLTATLSMLQVNLLLSLSGKGPTSFNTLDLMRLPLGVLSGIGFIGAGAIIKKENGATGVTTAATLWFTTMLGLLYGGGQIWLGITATVLALFILKVLKKVEQYVPRARRGALTLNLKEGAPDEQTLRELIRGYTFKVQTWSVQYAPANQLVTLRCELQWRANFAQAPNTPRRLDELRSLPGIAGFRWDE